MQIFLHIGLPHCGAESLQVFLDKKRDQLARKGVLYPATPGRKNHTRLFLAALDPDHNDPLRHNRGHAGTEAQKRLREKLLKDLRNEIDKVNPDTMILSALQLSGGLAFDSEIWRLRDLLAEFSTDVTVVMHVDEQARVMMRLYGDQVISGRTASLDQELALADAPDWAQATIAGWPEHDALKNQFWEVQSAPFWLDYLRLVARWESVFGPDSMRLRPYTEAVFGSEDLAGEICAAFDLPGNIGVVAAMDVEQVLPEVSLAQVRTVNNVVQKLMNSGKIVPRLVLRRISKQISAAGNPADAGRLSPLSKRFMQDNAALAKRFPALGKDTLKRTRTKKDWVEPELPRDFDPDSFIAPYLSRIDTITRTAEKQPVDQKTPKAKPAGKKQTSIFSRVGEKLLPQDAKDNALHLAAGRFAPHNRIGTVDETAQRPPYTEIHRRKLPKNSTGNVIVACMKNEGPYILEWIAYHRAIGVDTFLIYTNGCEDGTAELLDRLAQMGVIYHEDNNEWKGNSPQQAALNKSLKHKAIRQAEWIAHIDTDEFMNIRFGNGTLPELLDEVNDATNIAMTWRIFGHNDVLDYEDQPVIEQFDRGAPKYCPKPHTLWGFKTMFKNIGAYEKISCHRPTKLVEKHRSKIRWVNGSGATVNGSFTDNGWRSSLNSIGYDLIQLNHYALRSAESFLVKRQRGRALHVDRSIGMNYWIRMDFNSYRDLTIKRNLPRVLAEMDRLKADKKLSALHDAAVAWHRNKAAELHAVPEFEDIYQEALEIRLNDIERVALVLSNDMES
jgi:Glycosyl transferase family 2